MKKTIQLEIPEGKKAEWVNGVLTLVDEPKKHHVFKVGDKAILNEDAIFFQVSGECILVYADTEVEIVKVPNCADDTEKMYKVKYQNSTAMVFEWRLDEIKYKFKVGDIAVLKNDTSFKRGNGVCLISAGAEVEITNSFDLCGIDLYEIKFQDAMSVVKSYDLDHIKSSERRVEYKFKVGDKVTFKGTKESYTITDRFIAGEDYPVCVYELDDCETVEEDNIELYIPKDITERIKTFEDACDMLGKSNPLVKQYEQWSNASIFNDEGSVEDVDAYLKLRIITTALNEGWEPTYDYEENRYYPYSYDNNLCTRYESIAIAFPRSLCFKFARLAEYAATQFHDIYAEFFGIKKGGEE